MQSVRALRRVLVSSVSLSVLGGMYAVNLGVGCGSGDDDVMLPATATDASADARGADATTQPSGDESGPSGDDDASSPDAATTFGLDASALATSIYAGQTATFDAASMGISGSGAVVNYVWTVTSAPPGSSVTTASIVQSDSTASLATDKAGVYVLAVAATSDDVTATATVTITAYAANVVYSKSETLADGGFVGTGWVVNADGTNAHAFTCPTAVPPIRQDESGDQRISGLAKVGSDLLEGAANTPTTVVFGGLPYAGDGGTYAPLLLTDTAESCVGGVPSDGGARTLYTGYLTGAASAGALHPRFSPDGTKVLFSISDTNPPNSGFETSSYLEVVNVDGTSPTLIASVVDKDAGIEEEATVGLTRQAEWVDATHVGWVRYNKGDAGFTWDVVTASVPPVAGEPRMTMTCNSPGLTPNRVVFLKGGSMLAIAAVANNAPEDLLVLAPDTNGKCTTVHNLSKIGTTAGGQAGVVAFALSPDGKTVAYSACDPVMNDSNCGTALEQDLLYTVPVDGTAAPSVAPGKPLSAAGIRWVGAGTEIVLSRFPGTDAGGPTDGVPTVSVVPFQSSTDAGIAGDVATGDAATAVTAVGSGDGSCNASGSPSSAFASMLLSVLGLAFLRRRRSV